MIYYDNNLETSKLLDFLFPRSIVHEKIKTAILLLSKRRIMADKPNRLAQIIDDGNSLLKEDNWANGLFSLKAVVARIVKACVPEFAHFSHELIADECLEDYQDNSDKPRLEFAKVLQTRRPLPNGYKMDCDLLFNLNPPKNLRGKWKPQFLNIEVQNDSRMLDRCLGRGMLYASGIYYMEYGMIYKYPEFEEARRVNAVWICPAAPESRQGTILQFGMVARGDPPDKCRLSCEDYDKLRLTIVNVGGERGLIYKDIRGFVWALTTSSLSPLEKIIPLVSQLLR